MDSLSNDCGCQSTNYQLIKSMALRYCIDAMKNRSVDEQLRDFSDIFNTPLRLKITYQKTELEVTYTIGPVNATVKGSNESICVIECKRSILHNLKVYCNYSNERFEICQNTDIYSDNELYEGIQRETVKNNINTPNKIVLMNQNIHGMELCGTKSINEEICDLLDVVKTPLILAICYFQTEVEMTYEIGSFCVSVKGPTKSTCMRLSKIKLLNLLRAFTCQLEGTTDADVPDQEAMVLINTESVNENVTTELNNVEEVHDLNVTRGLIEDISNSSENETEVSSNDASTILNIMFDDINTNADEEQSASNESSVMVIDERHESTTTMTETRDESTTAADITPNDIVDVGDNDVDRNDQSDNGNVRSSPWSGNIYVLESNMNNVTVNAPRPSVVPAASSDVPNEELDEYEVFVRRASAVLSNVTERELANHADALLDVLVHANQANRSHLGPITDLIVKMASREPNNSSLYASLCSETVAKASAEPGLAAVRDAFRNEMKLSCVVALGDLPGPHDPTARPQPSTSSKRVRAHIMETCRFVGRLFVLKKFNMSHTLVKTVSVLLVSRDAHCLECLCELLRIVGPRFESIEKVSKRCSAEKVYRTLNEYAADRTLPPRTVRRIDQIIRQRNLNLLHRNSRSS